MSADTTPHDGSLGRRALITGAAVLGAAGVAAVAQAPDARAANGDALRVGRDDNSATAPTLLTVSRPRGLTPNIDPALKVLDNRSNRDAIVGTAANGGRGVVGVGDPGVQGTGNRFGGLFTGNVGVDGSSVTAAGVGVRGRATRGDGVHGTSESGTGVKGASSAPTGVGVQGTATHESGITVGVRGDATASQLGQGVIGLGQANGVYGECRKAGGKGVYGSATAASGAASYGVYGETVSMLGVGVYGRGPEVNQELEFMATSYGVYAEGAIGSSGPAFLGAPEYGSDALLDQRLQDGTMTFATDFSTPNPKLLIYVKSTDGRKYRAELPLTAI